MVSVKILDVKLNAEKHKNRKDWFIISQLQLNYTSEMEKAMQAAHGVGYEVYSRKHDIRMEVEKRREEDYLQSQRLVADLERKIHS
ncbi:hypothetical protein V7200_15435 [Cytobacillus firmus]|nr:hypothetical protein [Cytobacillus firmus]